jgi:hypothetical protein
MYAVLRQDIGQFLRLRHKKPSLELALLAVFAICFEREEAVTNMLKDLDLPTLQDRRTNAKLVFLYKVVDGLVPAIDPDTQHIPILFNSLWFDLTKQTFDNSCYH